MSGFSNLRPTGHMQPAMQYCATREVTIYSNKLINETRKYCIMILVTNMIGLIVTILWKIYKIPLILLHAARLKT